MKIIIPVIVGAIIGYFTNWLAIKMLFRPKYEKKIMGIKVPFTPGLIPKERKRIAESIGEAVGTYLLSPDTIIQSLSNQGVDKKIQGWIEKKVDNLRNNQKTIQEVIENTWENSPCIINKMKRNIVNFILSQIRKESFIKEVIEFIQKKIDNLNVNKIYDMVEKQLENIIREVSNSNELRDRLIDLINEKIKEFSQDERTLGEVLPQEILESIDKYLEENKETIGKSIKKALKEPSIKNKIKNSISSLIIENFNKVFFAFISPDLIADKIYSAIEKYIDNEETNEDIMFLLKTLLNRLMKTKMSDFTPEVIDSIGADSISQMGDKIIEVLSKSNTYNILFELIRKNLESREKENKEKILDYLDRNIRTILNSEEMENALLNFVDSFINEVMNKNISSLVFTFDDAKLEEVFDLLKIIFNRFLAGELSYIVEFLNIEKIVEDRINSFDVDFFEEIILEIADRELKAITWLGGLLGGILGLLSPLLQTIY